jgi:hypothetical protein
VGSGAAHEHAAPYAHHTYGAAVCPTYLTDVSRLLFIFALRCRWRSAFFAAFASCLVSLADEILPNIRYLRLHGRPPRCSPRTGEPPRSPSCRTSATVAASPLLLRGARSFGLAAASTALAAA